MMIHSRIKELVEGIESGILFISLIRILITATYIVQAFYLAEMIKIIIHGNEKGVLIGVLLIIILILTVRSGLVLAGSLCEKHYSSAIKTHIRRRCFSKIFEAGPGYINSMRSGKLESAIVSGVEYLEAYLVRYIPQILVTVVGSGILVVAVFFVSIKVGVFITVMLVAALFAPKALDKIISKSSREHWKAFAHLNAQFVDSIQGMVTLIAFNANARREDTLKKDSGQLYRKTMRNLRNSLMSIGIADIFMTLGISLSVAVSAYYYVKGDISSANLFFLLFLTKEVFRPIEELKKYYHQGFNGISAADSLFEILDQGGRAEVGSVGYDSIMASGKYPSIEFKNVTFSYDGTENVLENISFKIDGRQKTALVGESGSGKTTVVNLLMGFYEGYKGSILINGTDIKEIVYDDLLRLFSWVSQDSYLFNMDIYENIKLAAENASDEDMERAMEASNLKEALKMQEAGAKTVVGERGCKISGGQRQRISVARAILKDAPIVILDEPTSNLDIDNEEIIRENLEEFFMNKTSLTIAHRLSTVRDAHKILFLYKGKIVEEGTHEALMEKNGYYRRLFDEQVEVDTANEDI